MWLWMSDEAVWSIVCPCQSFALVISKMVSQYGFYRRTDSLDPNLWPLTAGVIARAMEDEALCEMAEEEEAKVEAEVAMMEAEDAAAAAQEKAQEKAIAVKVKEEAIAVMDDDEDRDEEVKVEEEDEEKDWRPSVPRISRPFVWVSKEEEIADVERRVKFAERERKRTKLE